MIGLESFKEYFKGYENQYVIIGGTACEQMLEINEYDFRVTKDIDMVLIIEALTKEFGETFWNYIKEAEYKYINKGTGKAQFYRFAQPKSFEFPSMIELFAKSQEWFEGYVEKNVVPIHVDDEVSSLSAILLDDDYYFLLTEGADVIDGVSFLKTEYLIPFKAKAWIDLKQRKDSGEKIDSKDIRKHKNDIIRLYVLLTPNIRVNLPKTIKEDMSIFLKELGKEDIDFKQFNMRTTKENLIKMISDIYDLK